MNRLKNSSNDLLERLQDQTLRYFWNESNSVNGLMPEKTEPDSPAGIDATGFALTSYPIAVERAFVTRKEAAERALANLRFLSCVRSGPEPEAASYNGFFYRLMDVRKGRRARLSELSINGTAIFMAGALTVASFFDQDTDTEKQIRELAEELYLNVNWQWALGEGKNLTYGWKPESGFISKPSSGFDEAFVAYILALASPTYPLKESDYLKWSSSYRWITSYGYEYLYAGPLHIHQLPHIWFDLRSVGDEFMRFRGTDYFENSSKATRVQQLYAIDNPGRFEGYGKKFWGVTLSDGPGNTIIKEKGQERRFFAYGQRGVPDGPDDGTISPWASVASIPFAPEIVMVTIEHLISQPVLKMPDYYGFRSAINPSFPYKSQHALGWKSSWHFAYNQGPALALMENYKSGLLWQLCRNNKYFRKGLERAGFQGGWLGDTKSSVSPENKIEKIKSTVH